MKKQINKIVKTIPYIIIAVLVGITAVYASSTTSLTPSGPASNTMYSLTDIYNLATGTVVSENTGAIQTTPSEVALSGKSLSDVYTALSTEIAKLSPSVIKVGTTAFGKIGEVTAGPATLTWQTQTDPALKLCWSHNSYEIANGCTVGSGFTQTPDTLTTLGAVEYCKYLNTNGTTLANTEQNIWHLPTIQEYASITDYTIYNNATSVTGFAGDSSYWSGTQHAGLSDYAWYWDPFYGYTSYGSKTDFHYYSVRCAH